MVPTSDAIPLRPDKKCSSEFPTFVFEGFINQGLSSSRVDEGSTLVRGNQKIPGSHPDLGNIQKVFINSMLNKVSCPPEVFLQP